MPRPLPVGLAGRISRPPFRSPDFWPRARVGVYNRGQPFLCTVSWCQSVGSIATEPDPARFEGLHHFRLELGLDSRDGERVLHIVIVEFGFAQCAFAHLA